MLRGEHAELAAIYVGRGLTPALADQVATQLAAKDALAAHALDELGISDRGRARPIQAALASAISFACGAALPVLVAALAPMGLMIPGIGVLSLAALALLGGIAAQVGGRPRDRGYVARDRSGWPGDGADLGDRRHRWPVRPLELRRSSDAACADRPGLRACLRHRSHLACGLPDGTADPRGGGRMGDPPSRGGFVARLMRKGLPRICTACNSWKMSSGMPTGRSTKLWSSRISI